MVAATFFDTTLHICNFYLRNLQSDLVFTNQTTTWGHPTTNTDNLNRICSSTLGYLNSEKLPLGVYMLHFWTIKLASEGARNRHSYVPYKHPKYHSLAPIFSTGTYSDLSMASQYSLWHGCMHEVRKIVKPCYIIKSCFQQTVAVDDDDSYMFTWVAKHATCFQACTHVYIYQTCPTLAHINFNHMATTTTTATANFLQVTCVRHWVHFTVGRSPTVWYCYFDQETWWFHMLFQFKT